MSAASITSADDLILTSTPIVRHKVKTSDSSVGKSAVSSTPSEKPSAIPRPSLNYSRPIVTTAQGPSNVPSSSSGSSKPLSSSSSSSTRPPANRSRTYSQPYPFDPSGPAKDSRSGATSTFNTATTTTSTRTPHPNNSILPTPVSSRPSTPITISATTATTTTTATVRTTDVKPTRIPKVTNNTSKAIAINGHVKGGEGDRQAQAFLTPETSPETWQVYENGHLAGSQSSLNVHRHQRQQQNGGPLLHEQPPFSAASSIEVFDMQNSNHSRASMEEETPFEHWYRGDLSRNGGVGELRIGSKMEMLEIANYGHRLRQNNTASSRAGVSSINYGSRRRRADSFGAAGRDSVMFDDSYAAIDMVLDEMPLTDMEGDTETDREMSFTRDATIVHQQQSSPHSYSQPSLPTTHVRTTSASGSRIPIGQRSVSGSTTATTSNDQTQQSRSRKNSQIPRPPTQQSDKTSVTSSSRNASSEQHQQHQHQQQPPTPTPARAYAAANQPFPQSQPLATSTPKRGRAKSPATPSKKPKPSTGQKRSKSAVDTRAGGGASAGNKEDIAEDEGEMLADAIPSWTKPVPKGNWDEVSWRGYFFSRLSFFSLPLLFEGYGLCCCHTKKNELGYADTILSEPYRLYYPSLHGKWDWTTNTKKRRVCLNQRSKNKKSYRR